MQELLRAALSHRLKIRNVRQCLQWPDLSNKNIKANYIFATQNIHI